MPEKCITIRLPLKSDKLRNSILKQATAVLVREERTQAASASIEGIRQITHKGARVMFFDPNKAATPWASRPRLC
jgi:hypothetical protein